MSIFSLLSKYVVETCTLNCHSFMYFVFPRATFITFIRFIAAGARCRVAVGKKSKYATIVQILFLLALASLGPV